MHIYVYTYRSPLRCCTSIARHLHVYTRTLTYIYYIRVYIYNWICMYIYVYIHRSPLRCCTFLASHLHICTYTFIYIYDISIHECLNMHEDIRIHTSQPSPVLHLPCQSPAYIYIYIHIYILYTHIHMFEYVWTYKYTYVAALSGAAPFLPVLCIYIHIQSYTHIICVHINV